MFHVSLTGLFVATLLGLQAPALAAAVEEERSLDLEAEVDLHEDEVEAVELTSYICRSSSHPESIAWIAVPSAVGRKCYVQNMEDGVVSLN